MRRYSRQMKLPEIGQAGQAKLASARVVVGPGLAGWIEARYLAAAGVASIGEDASVVGDARFDALDPAARDVALGAHAAVMAIKKIIA